MHQYFLLLFNICLITPICSFVYMMMYHIATHIPLPVRNMTFNGHIRLYTAHAERPRVLVHVLREAIIIVLCPLKTQKRYSSITRSPSNCNFADTATYLLLIIHGVTWRFPMSAEATQSEDPQRLVPPSMQNAIDIRKNINVEGCRNGRAKNQGKFTYYLNSIPPFT